MHWRRFIFGVLTALAMMLLAYILPEEAHCGMPRWCSFP